MKTLNTEMAAEFLHISKESVERMAGEGVFPAGKVGQRWVFVEEDLAAYLRSVIEEQTAARRDLLSQGKPTKIKTAMGSRRRVYQKLPDLPDEVAKTKE